MKSTLLDNLKIKDLLLKNRFISGPMAKISHIGLRTILNELNACGLIFTEMIDAKRLLKEDIKNNPWIEKPNNSIPTIYQLFVHEPLIAKKAAKLLYDLNITDGIDINMGCPAPNIKKQSSGIMLMKENSLALSIIENIRKEYPKALTVKIRIGFEDDIKKTINFVKKLEKESIDAITLHPRLFNQKLKRKAKWDYIKILKENVSIPVIGNGDILTCEDAIENLEKYKPDGIMISRGAAIKPWIFNEIIAKLNNENFTKPNQKDIWDKNYNIIKLYFKEKDAIERIARWSEYFSKNFSFGHHFWTKLKIAKSLNQVEEIALNFFDKNN